MSTKELDLVQNQDDIIVSGSTWAAIWHMTWPGLLQSLTIAGASFTDVWVAGQLGPDVQATIGIGGQIWFFMTLLAVAISSGTMALVSRFWGARDYNGAVDAARQSLCFAFLFGLVSCTVGLLIARPFYHLLGASATVEKLGWDYLKFNLLSQAPFTALWVAHSIFRAKGNPRVPLVVWAVLMVVIMVLDVGLSLWPFHLGVSGIGLAWFIAGVIGLALDLILLRRTEIGECVNWKPLFKHGLSSKWLMRIMAIGIPACIQELAWVGGNFVLFRIFAQTANPTACQASWAVGLRIEDMIACLPVFSLSLAIGAIVGQNLGAKQPERAELAGWQCAAMGAAYSTVVGLLMFIFALPIAQSMSHDPTVTEYTRQYCQIVGLCEPFVALWIVLFGAMGGAGYTRWPMYASAIVLIVFRLPLAWYLTVPLKMAPAGTWIALSVAAVIIGLLATWRYHTGIWKLQKV